MSKFGHVQAAGKRLPTAEIPIEGLANMRPVLVCKPANEDNPGYFNALLRKQRRGAARRGTQVTVTDVQRNRLDDVELISKHCVVGFVGGTLKDSVGNVVEYSQETCRQLFEAIVSSPGGRDVFDDFRAEVSASGTFVDDGSDDADDVSAQAGN